MPHGSSCTNLDKLFNRLRLVLRFFPISPAGRVPRSSGVSAGVKMAADSNVLFTRQMVPPTKPSVLVPLGPAILHNLCATFGGFGQLLRVCLQPPRLDVASSHSSLGTCYLPGSRIRLPMDGDFPPPRNSIFASKHYLYLQITFFPFLLCKPSNFPSNSLGLGKTQPRKFCLLLPSALPQNFLEVSWFGADLLLECEG